MIIVFYYKPIHVRRGVPAAVMRDLTDLHERGKILSCESERSATLSAPLRRSRVTGGLPLAASRKVRDLTPGTHASRRG